MIVIDEEKGTWYEDLTKQECTKCHTILTWEHFHKQRASRTGYRTACKVCCNKQTRAIYQMERRTELERTLKG